MSELSRQSGKLDINIEDDVDFSLTAVYKVNAVVVDITSYTATFIIRDNAGSTDALLTLTESAGLTIAGTLGKVTVAITDEQAIFGSREMVYDLMIKSPAGNDIHLLRGNCKSWSNGE